MRFRTAALGLALTVFGQTQPSPGFFELILPEVNQTITSGNVVADIPARPISRLTIQVLGSAVQHLDYGRLKVRINGKSVTNLFNSGSNARGKYLSMDPSTLQMRREPIFDPRENTIEVYGKDARGRDYYQNWILRSGNTNVNAYFLYVSVISPGDETGLPPDLDLKQPVLPVVFPEGKPSTDVVIQGSAASPAGFGSITVNGEPAGETGTSLSFNFDRHVKVARGTKNVIVEVADRKGNRRSVAVPVLYPAAEPPRTRVAGQSFALIIGISQFTAKAGSPPPLPSAAYDAKELAAALRRGGLPQDNIRLLTDESATVEQVRTGLGDFTARAKPEDFLLVFFATQGMHDPNSPEKIYLAASDTQSQKLSDTAIELSELQLLLNRSVRSRHTLLFFDAEHPLGGEWSFTGKSIVNTHLLNLFDGSLGRSVLLSGSVGEDSEKTGNALSRSLFSSALIEGLQGKADVDHNRVITAKEICEYVTDSIRRATGGRQQAKYRFAETEEPVLSLLH